VIGEAELTERKLISVMSVSRTVMTNYFIPSLGKIIHNYDKNPKAIGRS
jgi:hypothetical protein